MSLRLYRSVTKYPAYQRTSLNATFGRGAGALNGTVSLSLMHSFAAWRQGGFWFGVRPEVEIHRSEDKVRERLESMRCAKTMFRCASCRTLEWGKPGWERPEGWEAIGPRRDFCPECASTKTLAELMA